MRVEWAKSRARRDRWCEEVELVQEEMRRALAYLQWRSDWWIAQAEHRDPKKISQPLLSGLRAYALRQAQLQLDLGVQFARMWYPVIKRRGLVCNWPEFFVRAATEVQSADTREGVSAHTVPQSADAPASAITSPPIETPISSVVRANEHPEINDDAAERFARLAIGPSSEVFGANIDIGSASEGSSDDDDEKLDWVEMADV